jgi:NADPH-dependent curcumin reductase CurA
VQLAKNLFGAKRVVAIVGSNDKAEYVRSIGADVALNYKSPEFEKELTEATPEYSET